MSCRRHSVAPAATAAVGLALVAACARSAVAAGPCPANLFREYDPIRPPAILTSPPIRQIAATPYLDPDPPPAGTRLVFYKVHRQGESGGDPGNAAVLAVKTPSSVALHWSGGVPDGACCVSGTCERLCPADCAARGGRFRGEDVPCSTGSCSSGACCTVRGCGSTSDRGECVRRLGVYLGDGTSCQDRAAMCPYTGACCAGDCIDAIAGPNCEDLYGKGAFVGVGTSCRDIPPPCPATGACCRGGCTDGFQLADCAGGLFAGVGTSCSTLPFSCSDVTGACCSARDGCRDGFTREGCDLNLGVYAGNGTRCDKVPPPCLALTGACCGRGVCRDGQIAAACAASREFCEDRGGVYLGLGSDCRDPAACARVTGACCVVGEGCGQGYSAASCAARASRTPASYAGDGTTCADAPAPCEAGACCITPGNCRDLLTRHECMDLSGTFSAGRLCAASGC